MARLYGAFNKQYLGNAVDEFESALTEYESIYNSVNHYGRCIAILQSSGSGKSRLVEELGSRACHSIF